MKDEKKLTYTPPEIVDLHQAQTGFGLGGCINGSGNVSDCLAGNNAGASCAAGSLAATCATAGVGV